MGWLFSKRDQSDKNQIYLLTKVKELTKDVESVLKTKIRMDRATAISKLNEAYKEVTIVNPHGSYPPKQRHLTQNQLLTYDIKTLLDLLKRYESRHADYMEDADYIRAQGLSEKILRDIKTDLKQL